MAKPTKPAVSQFAGLKGLSDKTRARLAASPDAPGATPTAAPTPKPETGNADLANLPSEPNIKMFKKRGRPPGKKSSPDYEQTTVFLQKEAKWQALRYTFDRSMDLSMLLNLALKEWLARQPDGPYDKLFKNWKEDPEDKV